MSCGDPNTIIAAYYIYISSDALSINEAGNKAFISSGLAMCICECTLSYVRTKYIYVLISTLVLILHGSLGHAAHAQV